MPSPTTAAPKQLNRSLPVPLAVHRSALRTAIETCSAVLVCLDFDGTLAEIVEDPGEATPTTENRQALSALEATSGVSTAIVSGRSLADLRDRVDVSTLAGNHGLELQRNGSVAVHPVASVRASRLDEVCSALEIALADVPNVRIENKRLTASVHVRQVPTAVRPIVERLVRRLVTRIDDGTLRLSTGKCVIEIGPDVNWGKGNAVSLLASALPTDTLVVYVGDDVTDESAFRTLESVPSALPEGTTGWPREDGAIEGVPVVGGSDSAEILPASVSDGTVIERIGTVHGGRLGEDSPTRTVRPMGTSHPTVRSTEPDVAVGIGVRVTGSKIQPSAASFRVDSPSDVASLLGWIAHVAAD